MDKEKMTNWKKISLAILWPGLLIGGYLAEGHLNKSVEYEIGENRVEFNETLLPTKPDVVFHREGFDERYHVKGGIDLSFDKDYDLKGINKGILNKVTRESPEDTLAKYESKLNRIRDSAYRISQQKSSDSLNRSKGIEGLLE